MLPIIIIIIEALIIAVLCGYIFLLRKEQLGIASRLRDISSTETNALLWRGLPGGGAQRLVIEINKVLEKNINDKLLYKRSQAAFRATITNISHDLRTPLTSAKGYIQMLLANDAPVGRQTEHLHIVEKKLLYLQKQLDTLFDFARIESGEYTIEQGKVNVVELLEDLLVMHYEENRGHGAPHVDLPARPAYIMGDKRALLRVFQNVIQNALTHGQGDISVTLQTAAGQVITAIGNSCVLEPQEVNRLFERFYKADNARTAKTTGLGLAIAEELTKKMGGQIRAHYDDGWLEIEIAFSVYA